MAKAGSTTAMEDLCRLYWYPAYAFVRRHGLAPSDAEDLVQSFFAERVLGGQFLKDLEPHKGTFRSWFAQSLRHFFLYHREKAHAQKRGGSIRHESLEDSECGLNEKRYRSALVDHVTPERMFDQAFGVALIDRVLQDIRSEYNALGKREVFAALYPLLADRGMHGSHAELAARLGMSEGAVRVALTRLRQRFGQALMNEVMQTVNSPDEARAELSALLQSWAEAGSPVEV